MKSIFFMGYEISTVQCLSKTGCNCRAKRLASNEVIYGKSVHDLKNKIRRAAGK